jgi:hypothetical protein
MINDFSHAWMLIREIHDYIVNKDKRTSKAAQVSLPMHSLTDGWMDAWVDGWMDRLLLL